MTKTEYIPQDVWEESMDEKTKLMKVETADRIFTVITNAKHPFDIIDGHLIFLDDKGFPATSFAPGAWLNVLNHEGDYDDLHLQR